MFTGAEENERNNPLPEIHALQMMLDCAIVAGAELRLPTFVFLLRMAMLDLTNSTAAQGSSKQRLMGKAS